MFEVSITGEGLIDPSRLSAWSIELQRDINRRVRAGMPSGMPSAKTKLRQEITTKLSVRKSGFGNVMRGEVVGKDQDRLPLSVFYSKVGWLGAHVEGSTVTGAGKGVLIPINAKSASGRVGYKRFKLMISELGRQGNLEFRKVGGSVIVFAEVAAAMERSSLTGKRLNRIARVNYRNRAGQRKQEVAIAVYVPSIKLKKRLDFNALKSVISSDLAASVQSALDAD